MATYWTNQCIGHSFTTRRVAKRYAKVLRAPGRIWDAVRCVGGHWHLNERGAMRVARAAV